MIKKQAGKGWSLCSGFGWSIWSGEGWSVCSGQGVVFLLRSQVVILTVFSKIIKDTCKKHYHINSRIAELTKEGIEVKPCWVKSGGVNSLFYMYGKKEIRVQVAASKFKGKGNCKSKSALCAVLPLPRLLFN